MLFWFVAGMYSGTGYPSGTNYPRGCGYGSIFLPARGTGNPMGKISSRGYRYGWLLAVRYVPVAIFICNVQYIEISVCLKKNIEISDHKSTISVATNYWIFSLYEWRARLVVEQALNPALPGKPNLAHSGELFLLAHFMRKWGKPQAPRQASKRTNTIFAPVSGLARWGEFCWRNQTRPKSSAILIIHKFLNLIIIAACYCSAW